MTNSRSIIDKNKKEAYLPVPHVVHHCPGRVRFRLYRLKDDSNYAANLKQFLLAQPGINRVRVNPIAASIAIEHRYRDSSLAENISNLKRLIKEAATTKSVPSKQIDRQTSETASWSSLTLPVFTTINIPLRQKWNYEVGLGIRATVEDQEILVGSERFLVSEGISLECLEHKAFPLRHTCQLDKLKEVDGEKVSLVSAPSALALKRLFVNYCKQAAMSKR